MKRSLFALPCLLGLAACGQAMDALKNQIPDPNDILTPRPSATAPTVGGGAPIQAADRTWTWVPVQGAVCANGADTGFAVSLAPDSDRLLVFFEGGGACGDAQTCYDVQSAVHVIDGYTQSTFDTDLQEKAAVQAYWPLTDRQHDENPFKDASLAYVPYCTGDLHDGDNVVTYPGAPMATHHVGYRNTRLYLQALAATLPGAQRVVLGGFSAGGFAAALHRDTAAAAFPRARIDVIDDSGVAFADAPAHDSWKAHLPAGCGACATDFSRIFDSYATAHPTARFALLSYASDTVLPLYFAVTRQQFATDLAAFERRVAPLPNVKYFVVPGSNHVVMQNDAQASGGTALADWLLQMTGDDPAWTSDAP
jgi:hypothetical protein